MNVGEIKKEILVNNIKKSAFTPEKLNTYIKIVKIKNPSIVYKQAVLETGNFTSLLFKRGHNLFGMKFPLRRKTTAISTIYGHSKYKNWTDSVDDYKLWQEYYEKNGYDMGNYYVFLKRIYSEDKRYVEKLKNI